MCMQRDFLLFVVVAAVGASAMAQAPAAAAPPAAAPPESQTTHPETGALVAITEAEGWKVAQLGNAPQFAGEVRLHAADLDNNGAVDLLLGKT